MCEIFEYLSIIILYFNFHVLTDTKARQQRSDKAEINMRASKTRINEQFDHSTRIKPRKVNLVN